MSRRSLGIAIAAGLVTAAALAILAPAAGDWLVTRDGSRIETDGPWRVESRLVVFKQKDGSLGSLRTSEVDLEASRRLTDEMATRAAAPPEDPPPRPKAKVRLTQEDLPPAPPLPRDDDGEGDAGGSETPGAAEEQEVTPLDISSFREVEAGSNAIGFVGTVLNRSESTAIGVGVTAILFDREGEEIARAPATLTATALPGGQSASFRVEFPEVFDYGRAEFQVAGQLLRTHPEDEEESTEPAVPPPPAT